MWETKNAQDHQNNFEDNELQAFFNQDDGQTYEQLSEKLLADQSTISERLSAIKETLKVGDWGNMNREKDKEQKTTCTVLLDTFERK